MAGEFAGHNTANQLNTLRILWNQHLGKSNQVRDIFLSGGTGMIASSSTFRPHPGMVIRDLFRQLHAARHGMEALVYSNHLREAAASIIFG